MYRTGYMNRIEKAKGTLRGYHEKLPENRTLAKKLDRILEHVATPSSDRWKDYIVNQPHWRSVAA